jgi:tetratricopeptide (TPR) repeat protein
VSRYNQSMWKDRFEKVRAIVTKIGKDPRFKWYQRAMWIFSAAWAAIVVAQSVSYYTYIGNGKAAQQAGQYAQAQEMFEAAFNDVKRSFSFAMIGKRDGRYANALNNLAELQRVTGHYKESEANYTEVRATAAQRPGKKSEAYAVSTNNLAALYRDLAKYDDSEKLYKEAIDIWENSLKKTSDTKYAASLNGLAKLYRDEGKYQEAEDLYRKSLEIRLRSLGKDSQDVAEVIGNLGGLYRDEHRYKESEQLYLKALDIDRRVLGDAHPYVATDINNIAGLYRDMQRYDEADKLFNRALMLRQNILGADHPYCAKSWLGIAENTRLSHGDDKQCEKALQQALAIDEKAFGTNHPDYATACDTAFNYYFGKGDYDNAQKYNDQALRIRKQMLGSTHPDLRTSLRNRELLLNAKR